MTKIKNFLENLIFGYTDNSAKDKDDFADFFLRAKSSEQKKVFKKVIKKANQDQQKYLIK